MCVQDVDMLILPPTYDKRVPGLLLDLLLADLRAKARHTSPARLGWSKWTRPMWRELTIGRVHKAELV